MLVSPEQAILASRDAYVQTLQPLQKQGKVDNDVITSNEQITVPS